MPDTSSLNQEQLAAVTHGERPLLIIAGAGTGKTTVITKRIENLILEKAIAPGNILALTFTEKAAAEMETRIDEILPYGYTDLWIETFHAFCDRILRQEAIHIGLNPRFELMTEAQTLLFLKKNIFEFDLDYFRPLGNPMKFLQGMLQHFSRLKDDDITPTQYFDYAKKLTGDADEIKKTLELAQAFKKYEDLKIKAGVMDFSDLISNVLKLFRTRKNVLKRYQQLFKYILVDEFQDTNYAQNEMAILLAGDKQNITVVGDDDQCLPGNTLITTQHGKKEIKSIKIGEKILTAVGKGSLGISTVNKVFKNKKNTNFITLTTKSGVTITATENHKMFCYIPKKVINKQFYYVYLMYRQNLGWRLGTTNDLAVRLKLERSADAIIGLRAFKTVDEARYHELLWSLQYQIPTSIFKERDGIMLQGKLIEKLYKQIDTNTNAKKLADDLGINITNYHYILDAVTRGQSNRVKINVYQCYRNYTQKRIYSNNIMQNALITHLVQLETSNLAIIDQLNKHSIPFKKAKKGIRVRFSSSNIIEVTDLAEKLAHITGGFIEMQSVIGTLHKVNMPALIIPAGNLLEGLYVPIIKNKQVYYDEIIDIKREQKTAVVYDLEINKTHNFIANNIVVHNSIYRWRGAAISNMMQFRSHFPQAKIITLNKNYRSTQTILDSAYQMIQNNNPDRLEVKEKIDKHLIAMRGAISNEIEFIYTNKVEEEAEQIAKKIREEVKKTNRPYNEFAILVRANDHAIPFQRALDRLKIPYQFLGPEHLFEQAEIKDLIAYLHTLTNFEETSSLYRVLTISTFGIEARDVAAILNFSKKNNLSLFEAMEKVANTTLTENGKERITKIVTMLKNHLAQIPHETAGQILYNFFEDSGLLAYYLDPRSAKTEKEAQNVAKFFNKIQSFSSNTADASVFAVVDWLDMSMELGESPLSAEIDWTRNNAVNILTIHASKGLEFPFVFVTNLVTQRFPSRNRQEQIPVPSAIIREELPTGDENIQEERRLFYVAVTRAKDKLFLTASRFYGDGKRERKLSPFVIETLDEKNLKKILKKQTIEPAAQQLSLLDMFNANIQQQEEKSKTENFQLSTSNSPLHNITYISYSQLQTFQTCPLHYKLRYIMNVPSAPAPALSYGISIHSTLRDFTQQIKDGEKITAQKIKELLQTNWVTQGYQNKSHAEKAYQQAEKMLLEVAQRTLTEKPNTIAIELPFNFWLNKKAGSLKVGGRIDRIDKLPDGRIEIIDYKTGQNVPTEKKVKEDLQLSFYALASAMVKDNLLNKKPEDIILTLYYLEADQKFSTTRSQKDLEAAKEKILTLVEEIETSEFRCSGGIFCKNCEYSMLCQRHA